MRIKSSYLALAFLCTLFACGGNDTASTPAGKSLLAAVTSSAGATTELVTNGSFSQGSSGWSSAGSAATFGSNAASLAYAASSIWQDVSIPAGVTSANLSFEYQLSYLSFASPSSASYLMLELLDASSQSLLWKPFNVSASSVTINTWKTSATYDLSAYAGKKVRIRFTGDTAASGSASAAAFLVRNVSLTTAGAAPTTVDGKGSVATVAGVRAGYAIQRSSGGYTVIKLADGSSTNYINTTGLRFSDLSVNLQVSDTAQSISSAELTSIIELYVAYFNRVPDADGLNYWIGRYKGGMPLNDIGNAFYNAAISASAVTGYAAAMSNEDFIRVIYKNVLGQISPEQSGVDYWVNRLKNGTDTRGSAVNIILGAAHGYKSDPQFSWVHQLLVNKATVAYYTAVDQGITYNSADESVTKGVAIAAAVTATSTAAGVAMVDAALPARTPTALAMTTQAGNSKMFTGSYQGTAFKAIRTGARGDGTWVIYTGSDTNRTRVTFKEKSGLQEVLALDKGVRLTVQYVPSERAEYRWYAPNRQFMLGMVIYTQNGSWYRGFMQTEAFDSYAALKDVVDIGGDTAVQAALPKVALLPPKTFSLPRFELISTAHATSSSDEDFLGDSPSAFTSLFDTITRKIDQVRRGADAMVKKGKDLARSAVEAALILAYKEEIVGVGIGLATAEGITELKNLLKTSKNAATAESTAAYTATQRETDYMKQSPPEAPAPTTASACKAPATQLANGSCVTPETAGCKANERYIAGVCFADAKLFDGDACSSGGVAGTASGGVCVTGASVTSATATSVKVGESTSILVRGLNLANVSVTIADCPNVALAGGTTTALSFTCTPTSAGSKAGTVKDASGKTLASFTLTVTAAVVPPAITGVTPTTANVDALATFTVSGTNLVAGMGFNLESCSNIAELPGGSASERKFTCTPIAAGPKTGTIKDAPGGTELYTFHVQVNAPSGGGTPLSGTWDYGYSATDILNVWEFSGGPSGGKIISATHNFVVNHDIRFWSQESFDVQSSSVESDGRTKVVIKRTQVKTLMCSLDKFVNSKWTYVWKDTTSSNTFTTFTSTIYVAKDGSFINPDYQASKFNKSARTVAPAPSAGASCLSD